MIVKFLCILIFVLKSFECSDNFCQRYNCSECSEEEIRCRFNRSINSIDFTNPHVFGVDFSDSHLEQFIFGDAPLSLQKLNLHNNAIKKIHENFSDKMPHLVQLDLSENKIEMMQEVSFQNLKSLQLLNLSNALSDKFRISRELCELINIKVLDLSNHDVAELDLECWKNEAHLEELYLRDAKNLITAWDKWFPYIGNRLKLLDLTNTSLNILDSDISNKLPELTTLILSDNKQLDKSTLFTLLKQENLIERLEKLEISNIGADSLNLPLGKLFDSLNSTQLKYLDISSNQFDDDLNSLLFNQPKLKRLKSFNGAHNKFKECADNLIPNRVLSSLEELDLSFNFLSGKKCLLLVKSLSQLRRINLAHNELSYIPGDLSTYQIAGLFVDMLNLTHIDLSYNAFFTFNVYLGQSHERIRKFDLSHNRLKTFRFMSVHLVNSNEFPFNVNERESDVDADYDYDDLHPNSTVIHSNPGKTEENDDDERFILIDELNLSFNRLETVNLQHMLQSVRNIQRIDLSQNPIEKVVHLADEKLLITNQNTAIDQDELTEILCIDELDLSNCRVSRMPNLEHVCINKISLAYNKLSGVVNLITSKFTNYFLDYINLQENNITSVKLILSKQKFKSDEYLLKNSPLNYYLGSPSTKPNVTVHTYVDLSRNRNFKCDCRLIRNLRDNSFVQLLNECVTDEFEEYCSKFFNRVTINTLNNKIRVVFMLTCSLLLVLSCLIVYYMCADCVKDLQPVDRLRLNVAKLIGVIRKKQETGLSGVGGDNGDRKASKVHYSKLDNELSSSNVNLEL